MAIVLAGNLFAQIDFNREKEAALGAQLAQEILRTSQSIDSAATTASVEEVGQRLAMQMPQTPYRFKFYLIAEDRGGATHEPRWAPDGHIFVPAALILAAQSDTEFAGMLAQAMVHSAERHGVIRSSAITSPSIPLVFMGPIGGRMTLPRAWQSMYSQWQAEADRQAVRITYDAGYDPAGLSGYLRRAGEDDRAAAIEEAIRNLPAKTFAPSDRLSQVQEELRSKQLPVPVKRVPTLLRPSERK